MIEISLFRGSTNRFSLVFTDRSWKRDGLQKKNTLSFLGSKNWTLGTLMSDGRFSLSFFSIFCDGGGGGCGLRLVRSNRRYVPV